MVLAEDVEILMRVEKHGAAARAVAGDTHNEYDRRNASSFESYDKVLKNRVPICSEIDVLFRSFEADFASLLQN